MNDIKIILNEANFTQAVKTGFITYFVNPEHKIEFALTSLDVREIIKGKILFRKQNEFVIQIAIGNINKENIKEILKRSPVFSALSEEVI